MHNILKCIILLGAMYSTYSTVIHIFHVISVASNGSIDTVPLLRSGHRMQFGSFSWQILKSYCKLLKASFWLLWPIESEIEFHSLLFIATLCCIFTIIYLLRCI
jgi:hypothetical protein